MNSIGTKTIETQRLILRKFDIDDTKAVFENWASDENVQSFYREPVYETFDKTKELVENYIEKYKDNDVYRWAVTLKETDECIGQIAYYFVDTNNNNAEIEYCIGGAFQKKGYATEAAKAVIDFGFKKMQLHKISISHMGGNEKSKRVIEKCGFHFDGTWRDYFYIDGEYIDRLYYSLLENEYKGN